MNDHGLFLSAAGRRETDATRPQSRQIKPVFIVGQWKCGTTWLLNIFNCHPQAFGIDEIDIVRAACDFIDTAAHPASVEDRLQRFFNLSGWSLYYHNSEWRNTSLVSQLERGVELQTVAQSPLRPQKAINLPSAVVHRLYQKIKAAHSPEEAMDAFLEGVSAKASEDRRYVVLKAADQIAVFDVLKRWRPEAAKIVITRDGRDAAISAYHFERLMREKNAPWVAAQKELDYWGLLDHWRQRADMILKRARSGELRVIRYEDLTRDFAGTLKPLLQWLNLDDSEPVIEAINSQTSFKARTGRERGNAAKSEMRKGAIGEWLDTLSAEDKERAWQKAGKQLAALGYGIDGRIGPLPIEITNGN